MTKIIPTNKPTTIILHGGNMLGIKLSETIATQQSHILLIDEFNRTTKDALKIIKKNASADIFDMSAVESLVQSLKRVDYIIILLSQFLIDNPSISSKKFLSETNVVDTLCKLALHQNAKLILVTSIDLHRRLVSEMNATSNTLADISSQKPYTTVELQHYCENLVAEYHDQSLLNARIARSGELMGDGVPLTQKSIFTTLLRESITKPRITIPGEGLDSAFYVHVLDAVYGIIKALFSNKTSGEVYSLAYPDEISTLNLAYKILEMNPAATEIVFGDESANPLPSHVYVPAKNISKLGWSPKISFDQALHETMDYCFKKLKVEWKDKPEFAVFEKGMPVLKRKETKTRKEEPRSEYVTPLGRLLNKIAHPFVSAKNFVQTFSSRIKSPSFVSEKLPKYIVISVIFAIFFFILIAPVIQICAGMTGSYYFAKKAYREAFMLETEKAKTSISNLRYCIDLTREGWSSLGWVAHIPSVKPLYEEMSTLLFAADHAATGSSYLVEGAEPYIDYFRNFEPVATFNETAGGGSREYVEELEMMKEKASYFESASIELSLAIELFKEIDTSVFPSSLKERLDPLKGYIDQTAMFFSTLQSFTSRAPDLLGIDGRRNYVVVFQNPMEIRSTGGWITSIGIVGIEHGQVRKLVVKDVYEIDGQIPEKVIPPDTMKEVLNVSDWTLSLANWSPDFPLMAEAVEYFLSLSGDAVSVDGVFAVDLEFVRNLIDVWKSVEVPGTSEAVTKDNLYDKVVEIHRNFTPGSTQKPVFLSNLANEILQKTLTSERDSWPKIAEITGKALEEKHILLYFNDPDINSVIEKNNWGGSLDFSKHSIFPVEWNWGGNKANFFTKRITHIDVAISDNSTVQESVTVTYQNDSTENRYPEGNYVNFERMYIPLGSKVTRIEGLTQVSVKQDSFLGAAVVSGWISIPVSTQKSFTVDYTLDKDSVGTFPLEELPGNTIRYLVTLVKQPGLNEDAITLKITFPSNWSPQDITDFRRELNSLVSYDKLDTDKEISVSWNR